MSVIAEQSQIQPTAKLERILASKYRAQRHLYMHIIRPNRTERVGITAKSLEVNYQRHAREASTICLRIQSGYQLPKMGTAKMVR